MPITAKPDDVFYCDLGTGIDLWNCCQVIW